MNSRFTKLTLNSAFILLFLSDILHASPPPTSRHYARYRHTDGTYTVYNSSAEIYVRDTLPNEWRPHWDLATLQAGAVIIRSGTYWRINRSVLNSPYPNNNCYKVTAGGQSWYRETPKYERAIHGIDWGQENYHPNSGASITSTVQATDTTSQLHADRVSVPSGRPDAFMPHRYNATIQNRTYTCTGLYYDKIWCATVGYGGSIDPNQECSQVDDLQYYDPTYKRD